MYIKQAARANKKNNNRGYSLIEVLIAMAIFSLGILGVAGMQISSTGSNSNARKITDATYYAEDRLETLMSLPWADADLVAGTHTEATANGYTIEWIVTDADLDANGTNDSKIINLTVSHDVFDVGRISMQYIRHQQD